MSRFGFNKYKASTILLGLGAGANLIYFGANMYASYYGTDDDPSACKNNQAILENMKLTAVQVFLRHGARLPLKHTPGVEELTFDKDELLRPVPHTEIPHKVVNLETGGPRPPSRIDNSYITFKGGIKAGSLTSVGREQSYELGQKLRALYIEKHQLLKDTFSAKEVHARSTNVNRCVQTLESVLAGLYTKEGVHEKDPPSINVLENSEHGRWETLFPNTYRCSALKALERDVPKALSEDDYIASVIRRVNQIIGRRGATKPVMDMTAYRDEYVFRKTHGLPIDNWVEEMAEDFLEVAPKMLHILTVGSHRTTDRVMPLTVGRAFSDVISVFDKAANDSGHKLALYSCHDSMLVPLVEALGVYDEQWPPYCATLVLELYTDAKGKQWVKTQYGNKVCALRDCDSQVIPYEKFQEVVKPYLLTDQEHREKCGQLTEFSKTVQDVTMGSDNRPKGL